MAKRPKKAKTPRVKGGANENRYGIKDEITGQLIYSDEIITQDSSKAESFRRSAASYPSQYLSGHSLFTVELELGKNIAIISQYFPESKQTQRDVYFGNFDYRNGNASGTVTQAAHGWVSYENGTYDEVVTIYNAPSTTKEVSFKSTSEIGGPVFSRLEKQIMYVPDNQELPQGMTNNRAILSSYGNIASFFKDNWWQDPFGPNLI
jgi:hypothetical protein